MLTNSLALAKTQTFLFMVECNKRTLIRLGIAGVTTLVFGDAKGGFYLRGFLENGGRATNVLNGGAGRARAQLSSANYKSLNT